MLDEYRKQLDQIDEALREGLEKRFALARKIGEEKARSVAPIYDQYREMEILHRLKDRSSEENEMAIEAVWAAIFRQTRRLQYHRYMEEGILDWLPQLLDQAPNCLDTPQSIKYLGPSNSTPAVLLREIFPDVAVSPCLSLGSSFRQLREEMVDYLFLPLEDETVGSHNDIYRMLGEENAYILSSYLLQSKYVLLAPQGTGLNDVKTILASSRTLEPYQGIFKTMGWRVVEERSVEEAVTKVAQLQPPHTAVLATHYEAEAHGLNPLPYHLPDKARRRSRYVLVGRTLHRIANVTHCCFSFELPNLPRHLAYVMGLMADYELNVRKVRTYEKADAPWVQTVVVEIHLSDRQREDAREALTMLRSESSRFRFLGSYPETEIDV